MANINLAQNGLSIGSFNTQASVPPLVLPAGSITSPGSRPADVIAQAQSQLQQTNLLQFPNEAVKYYTQMRIYTYTRPSLMQVALTNLRNTVILPYPDRMLDINKVAYDQAKFGSAAFGGAVNGSLPVFQGAADGLAHGSISEAAAGVLTGAKNLSAPTGAQVGGGALATGAGLGGQDAGTILGATGYAPNYFLTVILQGPQYKTYDFSWTFSPRNANELVTLTQILRVLKDASAPGLSGGGLLFTFPRVFQNAFMPNPGLLYQFKPSVLVAIQVDYTAGGMVSMKRGDPATKGWNGATAVKVSCSFMELEFWLRSDWGDTSAGALGVQDFSNTADPPEGGNGRYS